ncbi:MULTISPECIES: cytochrome c oxidase assembly protein [Idiomarinaceae]|uniref:Cytochrome c oxidase assembly protein CtaG n=4 Tax=Pseudidiomarina TaxID=2800384 RepID=A0A368ULG3_9GAMM|nr:MULTISPECIES: cytochrome c oxidase assembly protein [Idiomarinaceae]MDT7526473.1 cytochrome c oxidase assembly protein [Pseudidiomarina sp. GXY010]MDX1526298.1 cytochrome c oxidase assembly protein [Pseudidiomarina maritima]MRJ42814.1 cytochrome c oxidase assembly protein [Idiomarina sp. FeN1]NCU58366.1 cytochrome c oxidase assembly protein [Idiomarina sp. FenA--70]NCU61064.1 cytochrome c oxidase assembly protein [Idiomarina sp. FenBw--71]
MQKPEPTVTKVPRADNARVVRKLLFIVVGMFGFGFALVPLYDVFCDITGFNGRTKNEQAMANTRSVDTSRTVNVQFLTRVNKGMPWGFEAEVKSVRVHPGETKVVNFLAHNLTGNNMVAQAIPSVAPGEAGLYLNKTECFCFNQQPLAAGAETVMPMQFYLDPDIPDHIHTLTLSYTMYDMTAHATPDVLASIEQPAD